MRFGPAATQTPGRQGGVCRSKAQICGFARPVVSRSLSSPKTKAPPERAGAGGMVRQRRPASFTPPDRRCRCSPNRPGCRGPLERAERGLPGAVILGGIIVFAIGVVLLGVLEI